jgi:hypothetical protein
MEGLTNCAKSILTPHRQLLLHNIVNVGLAFGMIQEGVRAHVEDNDPTVLYFMCGTITSGIGGLVIQELRPNWDHTQQFLTSLSSVGLASAEAILAHQHNLPTLANFAWINLALGVSGFGVQAIREFGSMRF